MGYIESTLGKDETVIHQGRVSLWNFWLQISLAVVFGLSGLIGMSSKSGSGGALLIGVALAAYVYIRYVSTELAVTNKRVLAKVGFISRNLIELRLSKIESVKIDQGIIGRMFGYGTLYITGSGSSNAPIKGISNPLDFRKAVDEAVEKFGSK